MIIDCRTLDTSVYIEMTQEVIRVREEDEKYNGRESDYDHIRLNQATYNTSYLTEIHFFRMSSLRTELLLCKMCMYYCTILCNIVHAEYSDGLTYSESGPKLFLPVVELLIIEARKHSDNTVVCKCIRMYVCVCAHYVCVCVHVCMCMYVCVSARIMV